jgi:type III secretory pathway lipoprotein EscJ
MRLLTEKYEEKLNRLETRLSEMEGLIATSVKVNSIIGDNVE